MSIIQTLKGNPGQYGTDALKSLLSNIFRNIKLDRNGDKEISTDEWAAAAFSIIPAFINPSLVKEATDLDKGEIEELMAWAGKHFPEFAEFPGAVEAVVSAVFELMAAILKVWIAVENLQNPSTDPIPTTPPVEELPIVTAASKVLSPEEVAATKVRKGAVKAEAVPEPPESSTETSVSADEVSTDGAATDQ